MGYVTAGSIFGKESRWSIVFSHFSSLYLLIYLAHGVQSQIFPRSLQSLIYRTTKDALLDCNASSIRKNFLVLPYDQR